MWKCKIVSTGACGKATNFKSKNMKFYDNVNNNSAMEKCTTAKKFWVEKPSKVRSYTDINKSALRQSNKNKVDQYANLFRFADKGKANPYPTYDNPQLGFGYTYNPHPINARPLANYNNTLFTPGAYPKWRDMKLKGIKNPEAEEEAALKLDGPKPDTSNYSLVEMSLPDWFCPIVCAGLDLKELMPMRPLNNKIDMAKTAKKFRFANVADANQMKINDFEENDFINLNRDMFTDPQEDQ